MEICLIKALSCFSVKANDIIYLYLILLLHTYIYSYVYLYIWNYMHIIFVKNAELFCKIVLGMLYINSKNNYFKLFHFLIHKEFSYYGNMLMINVKNKKLTYI